MCFDIDSGRVYISRDVIFDENVFRFKRPHPILPQPCNRRTMPLICAPCIWVTAILIWKMIIEILVPTSASEFPPQSFASLPRKSASIVPLMIGPRMLWADAILASPGPHLDSLGSNPRERSPVLMSLTECLVRKSLTKEKLLKKLLGEEKTKKQNKIT